MRECEHKRPILIAMYPDQLFPDHEPYKAGEYVNVDTIYDYNIHLTGHYCPDCETLLDVAVDEQEKEQ